MPIHLLGSLAGSTAVSTTSVVLATLLVGILLVVKTALVEGRKCTWERDWAGKFLIVIAPPSPLVYALLDHLVNLPHPPQVLYLPPMPSPLPQELLTILHAIRLSASKTRPIVAAPDPAEGRTEESSIPATSLHCEPLPRDPEAIREFMRKWAVAPPGTGDDGRRVDAVVWADEWSVARPWRVFRGRGEPTQGDTWAGVRSAGAGGREERTGSEWTAEQAKFHFLNSVLPFLLKAPMERSIRLVNVLGPFYSAAVPLLKSSPEEQGKVTDALLETGKVSPIVQSGKAALRNMLLWRHLQRVLDALASASHNQAVAVAVPDEVAGGAEGEEGVRQRNRAVPDDAGPIPSRKIDVQSNILALPVVIGMNRWGIVRPLLGLREGSYLGWAVYLLLSPLIYLLTPSTNSALQSILYALSAPVIYDEEPRKGKAGEEGKGAAAKEEARRDGVKGGGIIRDASWVPNPFAPTWSDPLAAKIWDQLEQQVEEGVKALEGRGKTDGARTRSGKSVSFQEM